MSADRTYDILLKSLSRTYSKHNLKWVRGVKAKTLSEAADAAKRRFPNLGITPTEMSMGWEVWKQRK